MPECAHYMVHTETCQETRDIVNNNVKHIQQRIEGTEKLLRLTTKTNIQISDHIWINCQKLGDLIEEQRSITSMRNTHIPNHLTGHHL